MGAFDDINLERTELWSTPPPRTGRLRAIVAGVIAIALVVAGLAWWMRTRPAPSADLERMASSVTPAPRPAPGAAATPARTELPPLDELDPVVSRLIGEVTSSPLLSKWLATGNLARQMAALVEGAAGGSLPLRFLAPLRPTGTFSVVERPGRTTIAPASYARYDAMADVDRRARSRHGRPCLPDALAPSRRGARRARRRRAQLRLRFTRGPAAAVRNPHSRRPGHRHRAWRRVRVCRPPPRGAVAGAEAAAPQRARQRPAHADAAFRDCGGPGRVCRHIGTADALGSNCRLQIADWLAVESRREHRHPRRGQHQRHARTRSQRHSRHLDRRRARWQSRQDRTTGGDLRRHGVCEPRWLPCAPADGPGSHRQPLGSACRAGHRRVPARPARAGRKTD